MERRVHVESKCGRRVHKDNSDYHNEVAEHEERLQSWSGLAARFLEKTSLLKLGSFTFILDAAIFMLFFRPWMCAGTTLSVQLSAWAGNCVDPFHASLKRIAAPWFRKLMKARPTFLPDVKSAGV